MTKNRDDLSDQDRLILEMWEQGASGTEIGIRLGKTRSAILGKLNRLRAKGYVGYKVSKSRIESIKDRDGIKPIHVAKKLKKNLTIFRFNRKLKDKMNPTFIEPTPSKEGDPVPFMQLEHWMCKYVVSGQKTAEFMFCGQPATKRRYCEQHYALCYMPSDKQKREKNDA